MPRVLLRNHKIHYQQTGEGPDILLIHGLACHVAFWWFHVAPELAENHRVTAIDLRGHGFSGVTKTGYRACDLAADVAALIEHLEMTSVHVVAHSFGGAVAMALATERPDLVSQVTIADGWLPSIQPVPPLPKARDWSSTIVRANARGIAVDPNTPLVVRGLYTELMDEAEFTADDLEAKSDADASWEDDGVEDATRFAGFRNRLREMRFRNGRDDDDSDRAGLRGRLSRGLNRVQRGGWWSRDDAGDVAEAKDAPVDKEHLQETISVVGTPGRPSHGVRRWQDLMGRTNARAEYRDTTAIEPRALRDIKVPVHLVYGARSHYRETAEGLQECVGRTDLTIVPRAGHYFPLLRPSALIKAILEHEFDVPERPSSDKPNLRLVHDKEEQVTPLAAPFDTASTDWSKTGAG